MAQPAGFVTQVNHMGIPVFWTTTNFETPRQFNIWLEQFLMTVRIEENVNHELILEDPKDVEEEPEPPKTRRVPKRMSECPRPIQKIS